MSLFLPKEFTPGHARVLQTKRKLSIFINIKYLIMMKYGSGEVEMMYFILKNKCVKFRFFLLLYDTEFFTGVLVLRRVLQKMEE